MEGACLQVSTRRGFDICLMILVKQLIKLLKYKAQVICLHHMNKKIKTQMKTISCALLLL